MGSRLFVIVALCLLAGCATRKVWVKDGASDQEFRIDQGQCQAQAKSAPNPMNEGGVFTGCMRGKGWTIIKVPR
jgi:hypothetical protein